MLALSTSARAPRVETPLEVVGCPQCAQPTEVAWRADLPSTDGPVPHLYLRCAQRHWFLLAEDFAGVGPSNALEMAGRAC